MHLSTIWMDDNIAPTVALLGFETNIIIRLFVLAHFPYISLLITTVKHYHT